MRVKLFSGRTFLRSVALLVVSTHLGLAQAYPDAPSSSTHFLAEHGVPNLRDKRYLTTHKVGLENSPNQAKECCRCAAECRKPFKCCNPFKRVAFDQIDIYSFPRHTQQHDLVWLIPFSVAASLIPADEEISRSLSRKHLYVSRQLSDIGLYGTGATLGGFLAYGLLKHDPRARETGILGAEAFANSFSVYAVTNLIAGRQRPIEEDGSGKFFRHHAISSSFPSGHSTMTWALASTIAHEYPSTTSKILWYGVASGVAVTRITGLKHFPSDVIVGSTLGYLIGRYIFNCHHHEAKIKLSTPEAGALSKSH